MAENENPYQVLVNEGMMTQEDAVARYAAEQGGQETTETTETTETAETTEEEVETTETTSEETTETTETTQAAAPDPFYKSLGYEDEDGVVASLNEYRALQERTSALQEREAAIAQKEQLISKFESPYSHDVVGKPVSYTHLTLPTIHVECRSRWSPYH